MPSTKTKIPPTPGITAPVSLAITALGAVTGEAWYPYSPSLYRTKVRINGEAVFCYFWETRNSQVDYHWHFACPNQSVQANSLAVVPGRTSLPELWSRFLRELSANDN